MYKTILLEGNIGSGKTTFSHYLSQSQIANRLSIHNEPIDKWRDLNGLNLLKAYYRKPEKRAFLFESYVALTMIDHHRALPRDGSDIKVMERSYFSAIRVFKPTLVDQHLMSNYESEVFDAIVNEQLSQYADALKYDLVVYVETPIDKLTNNIYCRARAEESGYIRVPYLLELNHYYNQWLENLPENIPVIKVMNNSTRKQLELMTPTYAESIVKALDI
ncbi:deoxynucleoside kinase-like [Oppia nitens]|uniref:deoxynucleoside kinase-like n=1 Tax=Oppia nitens TaxID=1686743 RepID=UPI0023D9901B|nr:deoxynucleoside kinase-like [Oppia nitens]XP_054155672.1 deoxynucleoside kinase-like [Oppia nitens]